jgi:Fur family ferric uptake transcriptional regulator
MTPIPHVPAHLSPSAAARKKPHRPLEECEAEFEKFLQRRNLRMTEPRRLILEEIYSIHDHFDADTLALEFRRKGLSVSRATVYRNLDLMVDAGLIKKVSFIDNRSFYEFAMGHDHHDHLICKKCGLIVEFHDDTIEKRQDDICRRLGFRIECHSHKIYGICPSCRKGGETGAP